MDPTVRELVAKWHDTFGQDDLYRCYIVRRLNSAVYSTEQQSWIVDGRLTRDLDPTAMFTPAVGPDDSPGAKLKTPPVLAEFCSMCDDAHFHRVLGLPVDDTDVHALVVDDAGRVVWASAFSSVPLSTDVADMLFSALSCSSAVIDDHLAPPTPPALHGGPLRPGADRKHEAVSDEVLRSPIGAGLGHGSILAEGPHASSVGHAPGHLEDLRSPLPERFHPELR
jgi:hypothetical protein